MNLLHRLQLQAYLFWAVLIGLILLCAFMVWPFAGALISAYILAYLVRPVFLKLQPRVGQTLASVFCILIVIMLIVVPISLISFDILKELGGVSTSQGISNVIDPFVAQPILAGLNIDPVALNAWIVLTVNNLINSGIQSIPSFALGLIVTLNGMFYLLCNWDMLISHLKKYLPFGNNEKIITELGGTADAIIRGHSILAVLEGVIAFVGFSLIGLPASLILAVLIFILAFIPTVGPVLVWAPLALYYFSIHQYALMLGVLAIGLVLMVGIEFFLYTRFVGSRSHIHPFVLLVGVLGGISVFGIFGFIIGPLLLVNSIKVVEQAVWSRENRPKRH